MCGSGNLLTPSGRGGTPSGFLSSPIDIVGLGVGGRGSGERGSEGGVSGAGEVNILLKSISRLGLISALIGRLEVAEGVSGSAL